ncbi:MAG: hypothetical protein LBP37_00400 [Spirochaetaceae bacterium]|nr:hypothetical protein [Spirochaetaceae bacterium]
MPKKAGKKHKLSKGEKAFNKRLARKRVVIEHVNARIKTALVWNTPSQVSTR